MSTLALSTPQSPKVRWNIQIRSRYSRVPTELPKSPIASVCLVLLGFKFADKYLVHHETAGNFSLEKPLKFKSLSFFPL